MTAVPLGRSTRRIGRRDATAGGAGASSELPSTALRHKVEAGRQFVQTRLCIDIDVVRRYAARLEDAGLMDCVDPLAALRRVTVAGANAIPN